MENVNTGREPPEGTIPLVWPIAQRDATSFGKDSAMINCVAEPAEGGQIRVRPRPGVFNYLNFNGGGGGVCQGLWMQNNGFLTAMADNVFSRVVSPTALGYGNLSAWSGLANAPWAGRYGHTATVFKNQIFIIGGTYNGVNMQSDVWATTDGVNWQQLATALPWGERAGHCTVVHDNRLYIMGGLNTAGTFLNDVWVSDDGITWVQVNAAASWRPRSFAGAVSFKNGIWVIGGSTGGNEVWFSVDGNAWTQQPVAAGFAARANHGLVVFNNLLYVVGGDVNGREIWSSPDGLNWTLQTNTAFNSSRYAAGVVVYNGQIVVISGYNGATRQTDVWVSTNATASAWAQATAAFGGTAVLGGEAVVFQSPTSVSATRAPSIFFMGGQTAVPSYLNQVWVANVNGNLTTNYTTPFTSFLPIDGEQCNNNRYFVLKDTNIMAVWYANEVKRVTDSNYPPVTVPGLVNLDERMYVMDPDGIIYGSAIGDPFTWPSFNYIGADYKADQGVAITKYGNYLLALGKVTFQLFYDSGDPKTALRPYQTANTNVGCVAPYTLRGGDTVAMWLGKTDEGGLQVFLLAGMTPTVVSTPAIDKMLDFWYDDTSYANLVKRGGHTYYVLSCDTFSPQFSLVFDLTTKQWTFWNYNDVFSWPYRYSASDELATYVLIKDNKHISTLDDSVVTDEGTQFSARIRTGNLSHGTSVVKSCGPLTLEIDGSLAIPTTVLVRYTDDDYQTWSTQRAIQMQVDGASLSKSQLIRLGSFRRRAWEFEWISTSSGPIGLQKAYLQLALGNT